MRLLVVIAALGLACDGGTEVVSEAKPRAVPSGRLIAAPGALGTAVWRIHDDEAGATCWTTPYKGAISCLPDSSLKSTGGTR